ncbi:MAG: glycosyltransferase [Cyclobacteriaceae bacterium]
MAIAALVVYGLALLFVFFYSLNQLQLVFAYWKQKKKRKQVVHVSEPKEWPTVTIQLPLYNELYVVERLIDSVSEIEYPEGKLEIQILDDSNDETTTIIREKLKQLGGKAQHFELVIRPERVGYKAGALKYGLEKAKGEFIAVFDADFLPKKDFLTKTIPHFFTNDKVGVVQTRWEHLNKDYSLLTKIQAFGLDAHFTVEQVGRNTNKHFINFNGTAGVWRKSCILDAGNWEADTLTEDLDLSYRAQIKGWEFVYLENQGSPAELPATMTALKSQQFRWNKGAAENVRKNLARVTKAKLPFNTKIHAFFHLLNSSVFLCVFTMAMLSIPMLFVKHFHKEELGVLFDWASLFLLSFVILMMFYGASFYRVTEHKKGRFLKLIRFFPVFLSMSMGLSLHNTIAVIEGYLGKKSAFIRTPKFNLLVKTDKWEKNSYRIKKVGFVTLLEALLSLYFLGGIGLAFILEDYGLILLHIMLTFGFGTVSIYTMKHAMQE